MIVIDSSAVLEVLLRTSAADQIEERIFADSETLHAPHLLDLEVAQVLRRYCAEGELGQERGREALEDLTALPINRYPHDVFLARIWELRQNVTAHDAAYLCLAETLRARLLTRDARLAAAPGHNATVELL